MITIGLGAKLVRKKCATPCLFVRSPGAQELELAVKLE